LSHGGAARWLAGAEVGAVVVDAAAPAICVESRDVEAPDNGVDVAVNGAGGESGLAAFFTNTAPKAAATPATTTVPATTALRTSASVRQHGLVQQAMP
jgi:hypothetical protein